MQEATLIQDLSITLYDPYRRLQPVTDLTIQIVNRIFITK